MKKSRKVLPNYQLELAALAAGHAPVAGVDEAGRGPWAGPVVAAAVILDPSAIPAGIADSKTLNVAQREQVYAQLLRTSHIGIGIGSAAEIDEFNILKATLTAMRSALANLCIRPALALIDGNRIPETTFPSRAIIRGDAACLSIAAASIIAKVTRDRIMTELGRQYPGYGFERHKGYGTKEHRRGIAIFGVMEQHRASFKPVRLAVRVETVNEI
jgi:ribonuclease HII